MTVRFDYKPRRILLGAVWAIALLALCSRAKALTLTYGDWKYEQVGNSACTIMGYTGSETDLSIPETIKDFQVTKIGNEAFKANSRLRNVIVPAGVTSIGNYAFQNCIGIKTIQLSDSVTLIGSFAFQGCSALTDLNLPDTVSSVGMGFISGTTKLTSIHFPSSLTSVGYGIFQGCNLTQISIPEGITSIGGYAFRGAGIRQVILPSTITSIGEYAFAECSSLNSINIPTGVEVIPRYAFQKCYSLSSITIPEGVTSLGYGAFIDCTGLQIINLPSTLEEIDDHTFEGCTGITAFNVTDGNGQYSSLDGMLLNGDGTIMLRFPTAKTGTYSVPSGIEELGFAAFEGSRLSGVILPEGLKVIGVSCFFDCKNLASIVFPTTLTSIQSQAFYYCSGLTSMAFPSLTKLESAVFYECSNLREITLPDTLTEIGSRAFYRCTSLTTVQLPANLEKLGSHAFNGCTGLKRTNLPSGLTAIEDNTFCNCANLETIELPDNITTIGSEAFSGCSLIESIDLPDTVVSVGSSAFSRCAGLKTVTIPEGVKTIGGYAFSECTGLTEVVLPESLETLGSWAFRGCTGLSRIHLPRNLTDIYTSTFSGCTNLTSVDMPEALIEIGSQAFYCCRLSRIYICPETTRIDNSAFDTIYSVRPKIICIKGSYADTWAQGRGLTRQYLAESFEIGQECALICGSEMKLYPYSIQPVGALAEFIWDTEDEEIATVTQDGRVTGVSEGETILTITAKSGYSKQVQVTVYPTITKLSLEKTEMTITFYDNAVIKAYATAGDHVFENEFVSFVCSDNNILYVDSSGRLYPWGYAGEATVTVRTDNGLEASCTVIIRDLENYLVLPAQLKEIEEEVFCNNQDIECVIIPDGCETIGPKAFSECTLLRVVEIPVTVTEIADDAFFGCTDLHFRFSGYEIPGELLRYAEEHCIEIIW